MSEARPSSFADLLETARHDINLAGGDTHHLFGSLKTLFDGYMQLDEKTSFMGLYVLHRNILVLGPYVGPPTVHTLIPISLGAVGKCADQSAVINIGDVTTCDYYISCCEEVKSEIVLPILKPSSAVLGVLDLDSNRVNAYAKADQRRLEQVASLLQAPTMHLESQLRLDIEWHSWQRAVQSEG